MHENIRARCAPIIILSLAALALSVAPALASQPEDAWITTKVKMMLLTDDSVDGTDINVDTFDARVTLHGTAATEAEKLRAERKAHDISGVTDVRNLIAIVPRAAEDETRIADDEIARNVKQALASDDRFAESDIEVKSVNAGIVVLAGEANTLSAHRQALEDARDVEGVQQVASQINSPDELGDEEVWNDSYVGDASADSAGMRSGFSDAWITSKAKVALMTQNGLSPVAINVDTSDGVVTLFGIVGTEGVKKRAAAEIASLDGVRDVENELQVVPDVAADRTEAADDDLEEAIQKRLEARTSLNDADIEIEVNNRVARLTGTVPSQRERLNALTTVRGTRGVDSVIDDLKLKPRQG